MDIILNAFKSESLTTLPLLLVMQNKIQNVKYLMHISVISRFMPTSKS